MSYKRTIITGGGGMLAQALSRSLQARGVEPVVLNRASLDITSADAVAAMFAQHRPTLVLNCAAHTKVDLCEDEPKKAEQINGDGPGLLAFHCARSGAKLVHYSTDFVFDGTSTRPWREDDRVNPLSAYGRSKLLGEQMIRQVDGLDYLILRTAWLYGPGGPSFPATMINLARQGKPLKVVDDQVGSPTFTHDLADATLNLLDANAASGIYHIVNAGQTNWHDFTAAILEEFGVKTELSR